MTVNLAINFRPPVMNDRLLTINTLDLDSAQRTLRERAATPNQAAAHVELTDPIGLKGAKFAMALKARATGVRSIVDRTAFAAVKLADLKAGKQILTIRHRQLAEDRGKLYYSSSVTNRSSERVRIDRFGTYLYHRKTLVLSSLSGGCYSSQQFQEWYGVDGEWLEPGQTASDRSSHSDPGIYWVYFGTTASGQTFIAGAAWKYGLW